MKKFTVFVSFFLLLLIVHCTLVIENCICQWYQISLPVSGSVLQMQFINSNTGWVVLSQSGYGYTMLRTTNQGTNWFTIYSDSSKVGRFQFVNDTLGYAMGYYQGYALILKTTNSGYNWTIVRSSFSDVNNGFYMVSKDTGWVNVFRFPQNVTMRTTNGFQSLEDISFVGGGTPATLYFFKEKYNDEHFGYMQGSGHLWKTTNSGYNWQEYSFGEFGNINSFSFINKDTGWVVFLPTVAQNSRILYTSNAGQNWIQQFSTNSQGDFGTIQAVNKPKIWCGKSSYNRILITTNGGLVWGYQLSPINTNMGIYFYDTLFGFSWSDYQLTRTTNGGGPIMSITKISNSISNSIDLKQNYPNPFNNSTNIKYQISMSSNVTIKIYDILGKEIATLVNENHSPGLYETLWDASNFSSGIYIYRLIVIEKDNGEVITLAKKLIYNK